MGFDVGRTYVLEFEGFMQDATIRMKPGSIATVLELSDLTASVADTARGVQILADHLVSWDLELDGEPIPATLDGLRSLEESILSAISVAFYRACRGISAPLDPPSSSGDDSEEELGLTDLQSPNPTNFRARQLVGLCERFKCLPSQLMREDASFLRAIDLVTLGGDEQ